MNELDSLLNSLNCIFKEAKFADFTACIVLQLTLSRQSRNLLCYFNAC